MKKKISIFGATLICLLGMACSPSSGFRYRKIDSVAVIIPTQYFDEYKNTALEQIEWYLVSSNQWDFVVEMYGDQKTTYARRIEPYVTSLLKATITIYTSGLPLGENTFGQVIDMSQKNMEKQPTVPVYEVTSSNGGSDEYESNLILKFSDMFYVKVVETTLQKNGERALTKQALDEIGALFLSRGAQHDILVSNGSLKTLNEPYLQVIETEFGTHAISGYVHAGKPNTARIKVIDEYSEKVYYDQANETNIFATGWSETPQEYFYFYQVLVIGRPVGGPNKANVNVQLWLTEEDGDEYCAVNTQASLKFWVR